MTPPRTILFAALIAAGIAGQAVAQSTAPAPGTTTKPAPSATTPPGSTTTTAPPATGLTGMDKGAGTATATGSGMTAPKAGMAPSTALSGGDRRFVEKAARGGMAEIEMSKLAMNQSQNQQVKDFAKRIIDDHTKANDELMKIAGGKGVKPPMAMDGSHKRAMDKLSKRTGSDFDRAFMDDMVDDHQKDIRDFRSQSRSGRDADLKAFATKTLPVLEQHLQLAKSTEAAVKAAGRGDSKMTSGAAPATTSGQATRGAGSATTAGSAAMPGKSTATPGKDTAATTGTAGPGTGMPTSSTQSTGSAPQGPGSASDAKMNTQPPKK